jgi:hypothetical protein
MENSLYVLLLAAEAAIIGFLIYGFVLKLAQIYRMREEDKKPLLI